MAERRLPKAEIAYVQDMNMYKLAQVAQTTQTTKEQNSHVIADFISTMLIITGKECAYQCNKATNKTSLVSDQNIVEDS